MDDLFCVCCGYQMPLFSRFSDGVCNDCHDRNEEIKIQEEESYYHHRAEWERENE